MDTSLNWTLEYVKNKDIFKKEITKITRKDSIIEIYKNTKKESIVDFETFKKTKIAADKIWIVCEDSEKTPSLLTEHWNELLQPNIWIIVVNIKTNAKWLIHPTSHCKIIPPEKIESSLVIIQKNA